MNIVDKNRISNKSPDNYKPSQDKSFRFVIMAILAFFTGFGLCVGYYSYTLINIYGLSKFLVFFAIIGFIIPLRFYRKWFHFIKYEMIIFNVLGVAPFLTGLFLVLNFSFSTNPSTHNYRIEKLYFEGDEGYKTMGVVLEENFFSGQRKIVELTDIPPDEVLSKRFLKVTISEGLFGFDVIKEKVLIE